MVIIEWPQDPKDPSDRRKTAMQALLDAERAYKMCGSTYKAAKALGIGQATVHRRLKRLGSLRIVREMRTADIDELTQYVRRHPATTLHKLQDAAVEDFATQVNAILAGNLTYVTIPKEV